MSEDSEDYVPIDERLEFLEISVDALNQLVSQSSIRLTDIELKLERLYRLCEKELLKGCE